MKRKTTLKGYERSVDRKTPFRTVHISFCDCGPLKRLESIPQGEGSSSSRSIGMHVAHSIPAELTQLLQSPVKKFLQWNISP